MLTSHFLFWILLDNKRGFIHNLSPLKRARSNKQDWYDFQIQTSPTKVRRVVGFNIPSHADLKHYEESKTPVLLRNVVCEDDNDWIFNQQSFLHSAPNSDVSFQYVKQTKPTQTSYAPPPSVDVTVSQIITLRPNQKVNISGTLTLGFNDAKQVKLKTQQDSYVKEDCVVEDSTGPIMIHIWEPLISQVKNGESYCFKNLTIKNFQGCTFLSSSPSTTFSPITETLPSLEGPDILKNPDKEVNIQHLKLINKLSVFVSCQVCKKRINDQSSASLKCQHCGTLTSNKEGWLQVSVYVSRCSY